MLAPKEKLLALQAVISKMSLEVCCMAVLPELGLCWGDVSAALQSSRLPKTPASAARVLGRHIARSLPAEEYDGLLSRLRLKLVATKPRVWHLISLAEPEGALPPAGALAQRVRQALRDSKLPKGRTVTVETVNIGELVFVSVQTAGGALFAAAPPGRAAALVSSLTAKRPLRAVVAGLGYKSYEDENLYGRDIASLFRIHERKCNEDNVLPPEAPEYKPAPVLTDNGIDFTNQRYNEEYVERLLGPEPPLLTNLKIQTAKPFFDPTRLQKNINLTIDLKSENVAQTLKEWVKKGALAPNSPFVQIFHEMQSNCITYDPED